MAISEKPKLETSRFGGYEIRENLSLLTGEISWNVYEHGAHDPISNHRTRPAAVAAIARYQKADRRRGAA